MNTDFIKTLGSFKEFMLSDSVPNYVCRYCSYLNDIKWICFSNWAEQVIFMHETANLFLVHYNSHMKESHINATSSFVITPELICSKNQFEISPIQIFFEFFCVSNSCFTDFINIRICS